MADVPVVLVHGFASSFERNWREPGWVDLLEEEGRSVIGVDLLGHGQAAKPADPAAYAGYRLFEQREELCRRLTGDVKANREWLEESLEYPLAAR